MLPVVWARIVWSGDTDPGEAGGHDNNVRLGRIIIIGSVSSAECVIYLDVTILSRLWYQHQYSGWGRGGQHSASDTRRCFCHYPHHAACGEARSNSLESWMCGCHHVDWNMYMIEKNDFITFLQTPAKRYSLGWSGCHPWSVCSGLLGSEDEAWAPPGWSHPV